MSETGFDERHEASRYQQIHPVVMKMGGWANFKYWVLNHAAQYFETCENLEAKLDIAVKALEKAEFAADRLKATTTSEVARIDADEISKFIGVALTQIQVGVEPK